MKISIVGYGQMGRLIEQIAVSRGIEVCSIIDPFQKDATHKQFCDEAMKDVDTCICFSQPDVAIKNIEDACHWRKQMVIGTTGWTEHMAEIEKKINAQNLGMVYSSNFSIGVNIFFKMVEQAAQIINKFDIYDIMGFEGHHLKKRDSPSGTAETIANILLKNIDRKTELYADKLDRKVKPEELHFASLRGGYIPGTHQVLFDSEADTIELKHVVRNRTGLATGAVYAAEWIVGRQGLYTEADMMKELVG